MKRERPIENNAKIFCLKLKRIFDKKKSWENYTNLP